MSYLCSSTQHAWVERSLQVSGPATDSKSEIWSASDVLMLENTHQYTLISLYVVHLNTVYFVNKEYTVKPKIIQTP